MYISFFKRIFDFLVAFILFLLFMPLFLLLALLVKLDSKGPVFFRQQRGGKGGRYFNILKFRSMTVKEKSDGKDFDAGGSVRITRMGKILRKSKLDELPQLINVIRGEMSLVGPRPEVRTYIELYPERWNKVLSVTPGITDPASVVFRDEETILSKAEDPEKEYRENILPTKLNLYEKYVDEISFFGDLKVLFKTVLVVIFG
jgi:lipopolysaccharide/colanic/teichoic acid biosynthesis glycosyltransferase